MAGYTGCLTLSILRCTAVISFATASFGGTCARSRRDPLQTLANYSFTRAHCLMGRHGMNVILVVQNRWITVEHASETHRMPTTDLLTPGQVQRLDNDHVYNALDTRRLSGSRLSLL